MRCRPSVHVQSHSLLSLPSLPRQECEGNAFGSVCPYVTVCVKPGVHTNDFAPIHRRRALKLGHASPATISPLSAHISADSPGESGLAALKVAANHNRCHY